MQSLDWQPNRDYLERLSEAIEAQSVHSLALHKLREKLTAAIEAYDLADETANQTANPTADSFAVLLDKQSHVIWLCNQCDYYLTVAPAAVNKRRGDRALWQIRAVVMALTRFQLLAHIRRFLPGEAPAVLPWKDLLPGIRLWATTLLRP
ncbi:MAG: hypothetical protein ABG776_18215 [Cyanobacteria bacterium J06555_13]